LPAIGVDHSAFVLGMSFTFLVNNPSEGRVDWGLEAQSISKINDFNQLRLF
jgi:hypothetical protein